MRQMTQFRYYGEDHPLNTSSVWPEISDETTNKISLNIEDYVPIVYLGIQALPGSKFYLNNNQTPVIIGGSGIYQLDLTESTGSISSIEIDSLVFDIINSSSMPTAHLIIDIAYEGESIEEYNLYPNIDETIKLYSTIGNNTDGAITQAAITQLLANMAHSYENDTLIISE